MKTLFLSSFFVLSAVVLNAQTLVTTIDTTFGTYYIGSVPSIDLYTHNFSNEVIETTPNFTLTNTDMVLRLEVENQSGSQVERIVSRRRIGVDPNWDDFLTWAHQDDMFGGLCFSVEFMDSSIWTSPCQISMLTLDDGEHAKLEVHINPDMSVSGCGTYRYYFGSCSDPFMDSVDVSVCYTVGLNEDGVIADFSVAPNPAQEVINVSTTNSGTCFYKLYNSVGQEVMADSFIGTTKIDAKEFENGIYFVIIESSGNSPLKKKIIIQH